MTVTTDSTVPLTCDQARVNVTPLAATRRSTFGDVARAWPLIEKKSLRADSRNTSTTFGPALLPGAALGTCHAPRLTTPSRSTDAIAHDRDIVRTSVGNASSVIVPHRATVSAVGDTWPVSPPWSRRSTPS